MNSTFRDYNKIFAGFRLIWKPKNIWQYIQKTAKMMTNMLDSYYRHEWEIVVNIETKNIVCNVWFF